MSNEFFPPVNSNAFFSFHEKLVTKKAFPLAIISKETIELFSDKSSSLRNSKAKRRLCVEFASNLYIPALYEHSHFGWAVISVKISLALDVFMADPRKFAK